MDVIVSSVTYVERHSRHTERGVTNVDIATEAILDKVAVTNRVAGGGDSPVVLRGIDVGVGNVASVLGLVDGAEVKGTVCAVLDVDGNVGLLEIALDVGESGVVSGVRRVGTIKGKSDDTGDGPGDNAVSG